jgi:hypothetical protein
MIKIHRLFQFLLEREREIESMDGNHRKPKRVCMDCREKSMDGNHQQPTHK